MSQLNPAHMPTVGVVMASPEAGSSRAKIDVAFFGWFWLIVDSKNILCLLRANSSAAKVKKEHVETFMCKSFYLLLFFFFIYSLVFIYCS